MNDELKPLLEACNNNNKIVLVTLKLQVKMTIGLDPKV